MPRLPTLRPSEVVKVLERVGFSFVRQRGSHRFYMKGRLRVTIAMHAKDMRKGMLRKIIAQSGLTVEKFLDFLEK
jgi:predicted RNA binding protein YcfA (HicA-like mRNA interferase family)